MYRPIQITAHLAVPLGVTDNFSPKIEGIIEYSVRESLGMLDPNPIRLEDIRPVELPLQKHSSGFYYCSSPHYLVERESQSRYRKRWDYQEKCLDWGNKKAKFSGSDGHFKAYDMPLFLNHTSRIDWFVLGEPSNILAALNRITHLGKKRSLGNGLVKKWDIKLIENDWSLWNNKGQIMRPIPASIYQDVFHKPLPLDLVVTAWRLPSWHIENQTLCVVPRENVKRVIEKPLLKINTN
jgi:hypothetical protein